MHNYKTRPKMTLIWCLQMTRPVIQRWQLFVECMQRVIYFQRRTQTVGELSA